MSTVQVRAATAADGDAVRGLALDNAMFAPDELDGFDASLAGSLDGSAEGHRWAVAVPDPVAADGPAVLCAAYWGPEPFGDRVWNLWFLAVTPAAHGRGVGTALVDHLLTELAAAGEDVARVLLVETSSTAQYEQARAFYRARGFAEEARIREFYGPDDDKVVFWRRVSRGC